MFNRVKEKLTSSLRTTAEKSIPVVRKEIKKIVETYKKDAMKAVVDASKIAVIGYICYNLTKPYTPIHTITPRLPANLTINGNVHLTLDCCTLEF